MGLITRGEATHRLKLIATKLNCSATAARDGDWKEACETANEAQTLLEGILLHLEEAFDQAPEVRPSHGAMGYRGSAWQQSIYGSPSDEPSPSTSTSIPDPINLMPPAPIILPRPPIVTPPPQPTPRVLITPLPAPPVVEVEQEVTFDLQYVQGTDAYQDRISADPNAPLAMDNEDWLQATRIFESLPLSHQEQITEIYHRTGKPVSVTLKVKEVKHV